MGHGAWESSVRGQRTEDRVQQYDSSVGAAFSRDGDVARPSDLTSRNKVGRVFVPAGKENLD